MKTSITIFISLLLAFSSCNFLKKGIVLDSAIPTTSSITQIPTTTTISQIPTTTTISQIPTANPGYYYSTYPSYNPYLVYTEPTSSESGSVSLDTNTVSQNLPQGGSQSTGYTRYNQAYSQVYNPQYGTYNTATPLDVASSSQGPIYTASSSNQQNDLLGLLGMAAFSKNSEGANAANSELLNSLFGSNGLNGFMASDGSSMISNSVTTNSQNTIANTAADTGSNANTDMTNNAYGNNYSGVTGGYNSYTSGVGYSYN